MENLKNSLKELLVEDNLSSAKKLISEFVKGF